MRRIALFSDIHANLIALDAALHDMDAAGVVERYCLGDLIGYGPDPQGVIERLRESGIPTIQGNYDAGVASRRGSCGCYYATDQARADGERSYAFTDTVLSPANAEWLLSLPLEIRFEHEGARILLVHGSPRKLNEYLLLDRTEAQLVRLADEADADLVCHGHIHIPYHRSFTEPGLARTIHYVSSGSVGKPKDGDSRACWVELLLGSAEEVRAELADTGTDGTANTDADAHAAAPAADPAAGLIGTTDLWAAVRIHRASYDIEAVTAAMLERGLPATLAEALRRA